MYTLKFDRLVTGVPAAVVWDVISDVERYADYAPNLSRAHKISEGPYPARRCYDTQGRGWNEACVLWQEGESYAYLVDTSDYPYPFVQMKGTWGLVTEPGGVRITMRFDYTLQAPPLIGRLVHWRMQRVFQPIIEQLLDNWEMEMRARVPSVLAEA